MTINRDRRRDGGDSRGRRRRASAISTLDLRVTFAQRCGRTQINK